MTWTLDTGHPKNMFKVVPAKWGHCS